MSFLTAIPIIGKVVEGVTGIIDKSIEDKDQAAQLKFEIQSQILNMDHSEVVKQLEAQASIITAEAQGTGFLQRNWRPALMCLFGLIIFNNYVLYPYLSLFFEAAPKLDIPPDMWGLLKLGVGGYVVGRSAEKMVPKMLPKLLERFKK